MPSSCPSSCSVSCISPCQQHCCQECYLTITKCNSLWRHVPGAPLSCLIWTIIIFNKIFNTNRKCLAKLFAVAKLCNTYTIFPSFCSSYCSHSWLQGLIVAWDMTKVSIPIQNLGTIKRHRLEGLLQFKKLIISLKLYIVCYSQLLSSQEERCFYISARKKSINNQTMEYNENDEDTTVKDLKWRATFKRCVTKRLWFILSVFCRIDKK